MIYARLNNALLKAQSSNLLRKRQVVKQRHGNEMFASKKLLSFASNDYLCLSQHTSVIQSFTEGASEYGVGSTSSALISGYYSSHHNLENAFADLMQKEQAVLFNSGYHANIGVLSVLANRHATVISDKLCHASIIDGIILSRAKHLRYEHNDMMHLEQHLSGVPKEMKKIIITESVFSMEGDICKIEEIIALAEKYEAMLIVDDAHGFGVIGRNGLGILDYCENPINLDCVVIPFGKACGSMGAMVLANKTICDALVQFARSYVYTTALPPAIAHATLKSIQVMQEEKWRFEKLQELTRHFIMKSNSFGLKLTSDELTPIKSILVADENQLMQLQERLLVKGIYVSAIRPPTVPQNASRIRVSLNCEHSKEQIDYLIQSILET